MTRVQDQTSPDNFLLVKTSCVHYNRARKESGYGDGQKQEQYALCGSRGLIAFSRKRPGFKSWHRCIDPLKIHLRRGIMIIVLLALIGAIIVMAILTIGRLGFGRREKFVAQKFFRWFAWYFVFNFILCLAILYFAEPALTGPFGGWQWLLWPLAISSIANLFAFARPALQALEEASAASQGRSRGNRPDLSVSSQASRGAIAAGIFGLIFVGVIAIVISGLIVVFTTWFDSNAKALAAIPNITMEKSPTLPPTDPNHIVLVSQSVASYKGQQILGSNGQNLGSSYNIDPCLYSAIDPAASLLCRAAGIQQHLCESIQQQYSWLCDCRCRRSAGSSAALHQHVTFQSLPNQWRLNRLPARCAAQPGPGTPCLSERLYLWQAG